MMLSIWSNTTNKAAQARKTTPEAIDAVAQGRVWTGAQALKRGLIDRTGSYGDALDAAAGLAKLDKGWRVAYIEREPGRLNRALALLGVQADAAALLVEAVAPLLQQARRAAGPAAALGDAVLPGWQQEFGWLTEAIERRQPFAAIVHCLCTQP